MYLSHVLERENVSFSQTWARLSRPSRTAGENYELAQHEPAFLFFGFGMARPLRPLAQSHSVISLIQYTPARPCMLGRRFPRLRERHNAPLRRIHN